MGSCCLGEILGPPAVSLVCQGCDSPWREIFTKIPPKTQVKDQDEINGSPSSSKIRLKLRHSNSGEQLKDRAFFFLVPPEILIGGQACKPLDWKIVNSSAAPKL